MGKKIRDAETQKIPFMIIVGENEARKSKHSVRKHGGEDLGEMSIEDFSNLIKKEIQSEMIRISRKIKFN